MAKQVELRIQPAPGVATVFGAEPVFSQVDQGARYLGRVVLELWEDGGSGQTLAALIDAPAAGARQELLERARTALG